MNKDDFQLSVINFGSDMPKEKKSRIFDLIISAYSPDCGYYIYSDSDFDNGIFTFITDDAKHLNRCLTDLAEEMKISHPVCEILDVPVKMWEDKIKELNES